MPACTTLAVDDLRVGHYVYLDLKWFEHPFAFSHFKIKTDAQIQTLRGLGLRAVRIDPDLSDVVASPAGGAGAPAASPEAAAAAAVDEEVMARKKAMIEFLAQRRQRADQVEKDYLGAADRVREIETHLFAKPRECVELAKALVSDMSGSILNAIDLAIQVMADKAGSEDAHFHSLNVTTLALMIARDLKLPLEVMNVLGLAALMHDVGMAKVPEQVRKATKELNPAERSLFQMHCRYGVEIGRSLQLPPAVLPAILQHHEHFDGTGYPQGLEGEEIHLLARIIAIADCYDELCNPPRAADAMTPHEALSLMFAKQRGRFDSRLLQTFIRCLGVYPPGTLVQLSNSVLGMVVSVNTASPLKPTLVLYDPEVPKAEAIVIDMARETEVTISKAIHPTQLPPEVHRYLNPRKRVSYYFDASGGPSGAAA